MLESCFAFLGGVIFAISGHQDRGLLKTMAFLGDYGAAYEGQVAWFGLRYTRAYIRASWLER